MYKAIAWDVILLATYSQQTTSQLDLFSPNPTNHEQPCANTSGPNSNEKSMVPHDPRDCPVALDRSQTYPLRVVAHCADAQKLNPEDAKGPCNWEHDNTECRRNVRRIYGWLCHRCNTFMRAVDDCTQCKHDECEDCTQATT